jgi:hypothetical protein
MMATESAFVGVAHDLARLILPMPQYDVRRGASLLYRVTVDNNLSLTLDANRIREPVRGDSAFQTDLCVFEVKANGLAIPRVAIEFKTRITTHDVITYSAKASKHKQVYPYLRYGLVASSESSVPGRLFTHNESLDFCAAIAGLDNVQLEAHFRRLLTSELESSRSLEAIAFGTIKTRVYRSEVIIEPHTRKIDGNQSLEGIAMINLDADAESADWTKQSWDLPPYLSKEFFDVMGPAFNLEQFKTTPIYIHAVDTGLIHDDEWVADHCQPAIATTIKA